MALLSIVPLISCALKKHSPGLISFGASQLSLILFPIKYSAQVFWLGLKATVLCHLRLCYTSPPCPWGRHAKTPSECLKRDGTQP